jgi:hypothetical protein
MITTQFLMFSCTWHVCGMRVACVWHACACGVQQYLVLCCAPAARGGTGPAPRGRYEPRACVHACVRACVPRCLWGSSLPSSAILCGTAHLVVELGVDARVVDEGAEVGRLVPAHRVVVHVNLAQALHHVHLVLGAVLIAILLRRAGGRRGGLLVLVGKGEAVRDL